MAELSYPWGVDASDAVAADSRLYQTGWRELVGGNLPDGVVFDRSNATPANGPLYVSATGTNTTLTVGVGSAVVQGALYDNTTIKAIDVATIGTQPSAGQSRTDSVILKYDPTATPASSRLSVQLKPGTPATSGSQQAPSLTKDPAGIWEVEIARVTRASASNITQVNITQLHPRPVMAVKSVNAPGNPAIGQVWYDANNSARSWTGTTWQYTGGGRRPMCLATNSTQSAVGSGSFTNTILDGEIVDTDSMHSTTVNNSRITINTPGLYRVWGCSAWAVDSTAGTRGGYIRKNGSIIVEGTYALTGSAPSSSPGFTSVPLGPSAVQLAAGDYLELLVYQSSGSSLTLFTSAGVKPFLAAEWVMP